MANKAVFEIVVTNKGLKITQKGVDDLGASVERTKKKTQEANKASGDYYNTQAKGVIGTANSTKSFSKLAQTIGDENSGLVGAYATLAANAFAVSAAFNVLKEASQAEAVMKGLEVQSARLGVTLTGTAKRVEELARGQLSLTEAMQATAQASATGFNSQSIEDLTKVAQNASIALGRNMGDSMDRLIKGTSKLEPELLDELGIMVKLEEATTKYALQTGKTAASLTSFERRQAFLNAVLEEGQTKFGGLSEEVRPDPYVQLAAAFNNLTKETLGFINNTLGVSSVVGFLADNTTALVSVIVMFAGTISRQLVPSLYQVSEATLRAKAAIDRKIQSQKKQIDLTLKQAATEKKAAAESATGKIDVVSSPERVKKYVEALKAGTVVEGQREAALRSLNGALGGHERALNRIADQNSVEAKSRQEIIRQLTEQKAALQSLTTAELAHANVVSNSQQKLNALRLESRGLRRLDLALSERASAIEAAGEGRIRDAVNSSSRSVGIYAIGLRRVADAKVAAAAGGTLFSRSLAVVSASTVTARTGLFALGLGVRALGAAFLNAIPIIGQVLFAVSLIQEYGGMVWDWMFPPPAGQEALDKAKEALDEILDRVDETAKKTSPVFADAGRSAGEAAGAYLALSNTVKEVGDAFKAVEEAQKQLGTTSAAKSSELLKTAFEAQGQTLSSDVVDSEAFKSLNSLAKLGFEPLNKEIMKATVNSREFQEASDERQIEILAKALGNLSSKYASVGTAVQEVRSSYKNLEDATANFIKSATPSTPYDGLVDNLTASRIAVLNLEAELAKGTITYEDFAKQITDLGPKAASLFDATTQQQIKAIEDLEVAAKAGRAELEKMGSATLGDYNRKLQEVKRVEAELNEARRVGTSSVLKALEAEQQRVLALQKQSVIAEGQLKLEQAKFSTVQNSLSSTGAGYRVQIAQEEKIRDMQVAKIRAEQAVLESLNLQNTLKLNSLKLQEQELKLKIENLKSDKASLDIISRITERIGKLTGWWKDTEQETKDAEAQLKNLQGTIAGVEAESAKLGNAITAYNFNAAAILAENLTEAQKAAAALKIDFENIQKLGDKIRGSQAEVLSYEERRQAVANAMSISSLRDLQATISRFNREKTLANQTLKQAEDKLEVELKAERAALNRVGADTAAGKAVAVKISLLEKELDITRQTASIQEDILRATLAIELTERFRVDTLGNGLEIQQNAVSLLQKEFDLKRGLLQQERDLATARLRVLVGPNINPRTERALEAKALADEYKLAVQQFGLRMAAIDAEYALLEAQRLQLEFNLKAQKAFLEQQAMADGTIDDRERRGLDQVSNAIDMIGAVDYSVMKDLAKETERNSLELLRVRAMEARGPAGGLFGGAAGAILQGASIFENLSAASKSLEQAKNPVDTLSKAVLPDFSKATIDAEKALSEFTTQIKTLDLNIPELKTKLFEIADTFNAFLNKLKEEGSVASEAASMGRITGRSQDDMAKTMQIAMGMATEAGAKYWQYGAQAGHSGKGHKEFRAIDVYMAPGTQEATDPAIRAKMDSLAEQYALKGYVVLWNKVRYSLSDSGEIIKTAIEKGAHQHRTHMHVEALSAGVILRESIKEGGTEAATSIEKAVVASAANDNKKAYTSFDSAPQGSLAVSLGEQGSTGGIEVGGIKAKSSINDFLQTATPSLEYFIEQFASLGPQGEIMSTVLNGFLNFGEQLNTTLTVVGMSTEELSKSVGKDLTETEASLLKISSGFSTAASAIGAINQILQAGSNAKIANIDREIAAEQQRDGKSAASVARIEAMEKKKDSIARKAFNTNKKLMMAQAVMGTAAAITMALATLPPPASFIMAGIAGALGAAQIAVIAGTQYESTSASRSGPVPSTISIGRRSDTVDLARGPSANAGGEVGFIRGSQGTGSNANNFRTIGSAYGGELMRGYGNRGFVVGEKGPEVITPETPINVTPANDVMPQQPLNATFNIQALDASGVEELLVAQKGNIISMLRSAANAAGQGFLESVDTNIYTRPSVNKL